VRQGVEPGPLSSAALEASINAVLVRAERSVTLTGERLLVERLHQALDEGGSAALMTLSNTVWPQVQALVTALPALLQEHADPATAGVVQDLGAALQGSGLSLEEILNEGIALHDRVLAEVGQHLRESDRIVVAALSQLSRALLRLGQGALLAYYDQATSELTQMANTDSLTGLANRRYFELRSDEELQRARRTGRPLALLLIDVNGLKLINDAFLHAAGDQLLRTLASVLRGQARGIDVAARLGGDEFALLLPETDGEGAQALLSRLRQSVAEERINGQPITFSAGLAVYPEHGQTVADLMAHADSALYHAKRRPLR